MKKFNVRIILSQQYACDLNNEFMNEFVDIKIDAENENKALQNFIEKSFVLPIPPVEGYRFKENNHLIFVPKEHVTSIFVREV